MDNQHWPTGHASQSPGSALEAPAAAATSLRPPPPPGAPASSPRPLADWPLPPTGPIGGSGGAGAAIKLWSARDVGLISFLFGFPAGLGLAAVNWYRLGRPALAFAHLAAGTIGCLLIVLWTGTATGFAAGLNVGVALYLYVSLRATLRDAIMSGVTVQGGGNGAGLGIALASWVLMFTPAVVLAGVLGAPGAVADLPPGVVQASPVPAATMAAPAATPAPSPADIGADPGASLDLSACDTSRGMPHQAADLEAQLPRRVGGRDLSTWSVAGWCWLQMAMGEDAVAELAPNLRAESIDVDNLQYAIAGRVDTQADPPYFVFAAYRPQANAEIDIALGLMLRGAGYRNGFTIDLSEFEPRELGDRVAFVGTTDMVAQSEHQRGRPWVYQTDSAMFLIITDNDAWAEDAIRQLPCCWTGS